MVTSRSMLLYEEKERISIQYASSYPCVFLLLLVVVAVVEVGVVAASLLGTLCETSSHLGRVKRIIPRGLVKMSILGSVAVGSSLAPSVANKHGSVTNFQRQAARLNLCFILDP